MAAKSKKPSNRWGRGRSGNGAILIVIHESDGVLYLSPKPGGERVRRGRNLALVAVNLTNDQRDVEIEFDTSIGGKRKHKVLSVGAWDVNHKMVPIPSDLFEPWPPGENVIAVHYEVRVDGVEVDPDLEIER